MQNVPTYRWDQQVKRDAGGMGKASLGEIKQIGPGWAMTEKAEDKGTTRFYLPKCLVKGFDGKVTKEASSALETSAPSI
jgi:hypothetical protein